MKASLAVLKEEIEQVFGSALSQEIEMVLNAMSVNLKNNFSQLKDHLNKLEKKIIDAIESREKKDIDDLKKLVETKELQILELTEKIGESKGQNNGQQNIN